MATIKFHIGQEANLPTQLDTYGIYRTLDTNKLLIVDPATNALVVPNNTNLFAGKTTNAVHTATSMSEGKGYYINAVWFKSTTELVIYLDTVTTSLATGHTCVTVTDESDTYYDASFTDFEDLYDDLLGADVSLMIRGYYTKNAQVENRNYDCMCTIGDIQHNCISLDFANPIPFTSVAGTSTWNRAPIMYLPAHPELGIVTLDSCSVSFGDSNITSMGYCISAGYGNLDSGRFSASFGSGNKAGHAALVAGKGCSAIGQYSFSVGQNCQSLEDSAVSMGALSIASDRYTVALGNRANASAQGAIALGQSAKASGKDSFSFRGNATNYGSIAFLSTASGENAISLNGNAVGNNSIALRGTSNSPYSISIGGVAGGEYSVAILGSTSNTRAISLNGVANGPDSTAISGGTTTATANKSVAMINGTASGSNSFAVLGTASNSNAISLGGTASGVGSISLGGTASGERAVSTGSTTEASGKFSATFGYGTVAQRKGQVAIGYYNVRDTEGDSVTDKGKYAFIIGNGSSDNSRKNVFSVEWGGWTTASGLTVGEVDADYLYAYNDAGLQRLTVSTETVTNKLVVTTDAEVNNKLYAKNADVSNEVTVGTISTATDLDTNYVQVSSDRLYHYNGGSVQSFNIDVAGASFNTGSSEGIPRISLTGYYDSKSHNLSISGDGKIISTDPVTINDDEVLTVNSKKLHTMHNVHFKCNVEVSQTVHYSIAVSISFINSFTSRITAWHQLLSGISSSYYDYDYSTEISGECYNAGYVACIGTVTDYANSRTYGVYEMNHEGIIFCTNIGSVNLASATDLEITDYTYQVIL